jgi:hypothetical protein
VQAQHDYLQGNYPVGRDDAAQLAALQIQAEMGGSFGGAAEPLDALAVSGLSAPFTHPSPNCTALVSDANR